MPGSPLTPCQVLPLFLLQGSLLSTDMAENSPPPPSPAAAPVAEPGVTEQPGPQSPPPSPPGPEEPMDGVDPEVPHPDLAPVAFFCLRQTTSPRNWCIKMVCNPYPLWGLGLSGFCPGPPLVPLARRPVAWTEAERLWCRLASSGAGPGRSRTTELRRMRTWRPADVNVLEVADDRGQSVQYPAGSGSPRV